MNEHTDISGDISDFDPRTDPMAPPDEPCECYCLHCGRVFMSDQMWFQRVVNARDNFPGFWMCPTHNCSGAGFTIDIFPTDPDHPANAGWFDDDEDWEDDSEHDEWDPEESRYRELEEELGEDEDIEGEEWKYGLAPGERPPQPQWAEEARREWEEEQKKYDSPDERPREIDWSEREDSPSAAGGEFNEDDIPF